MLCEVGWVISRKRILYLSGRYWRIKQRKGASRIVNELQKLGVLCGCTRLTLTVSFFDQRQVLAYRFLCTLTNHSGGIQGGISNGEDIYFRVAFKPIATILRDIRTLDYAGNPINLKAKGRHDPCVLPRAVPIVEAMTAMVLLDHYLLNKTRHL